MSTCPSQNKHCICLGSDKKSEATIVRPDMEKWGQTPAELRVLSVETKDARSRERFLALNMIADRQSSACRWARTIGRGKETVLNWVHRYNQLGPEAVFYRHSGGRRPSMA